MNGALRYIPVIRTNGAERAEGSFSTGKRTRYFLMLKTARENNPGIPLLILHTPPVRF